MALQLFTQASIVLNATSTLLNTGPLALNRSKVDCHLNGKFFDWNGRCCCDQNEKMIIDSIRRPPLVFNGGESWTGADYRDKRLRGSNKDDIRIKYTSKHPYRADDDLDYDLNDNFDDQFRQIRSIGQRYSDKRNYQDKLNRNKRRSRGRSRGKSSRKKTSKPSSIRLKSASSSTYRRLNGTIDSSKREKRNKEIINNNNKQSKLSNKISNDTFLNQQNSSNSSVSFKSLSTFFSKPDSQISSLNRTLFSLPLFPTTSSTLNENNKQTLSGKQLSKRSPLNLDSSLLNTRDKSTSSNQTNEQLPISISSTSSSSSSSESSDTVLFNKRNSHQTSPLDSKHSKQVENLSTEAFSTTTRNVQSTRPLYKDSLFHYQLPISSRLVLSGGSSKSKELDELLISKKLRKLQNDTNYKKLNEEFTTEPTDDNLYSSTPLYFNNSQDLNLTDSNDNRTVKNRAPIEFTVKTVIVLILAVFLSLITIIGNMLVMVSLVIDRQLRTISNYYLLSLSIADFTIGVVSMPLYTIYNFLGYWPFGNYVCDAWLSLDYLMSNASVLNLLVISFDRYFSVTRPLTYRLKRTTKRAFLWMFATYLISSILWPPWIIYYPIYEGRTVPEDQCYIQFLQTSKVITFCTAIAAFYIPVFTMIYLNFMIWKETQQRYKDITTLFLVSTAGGKVIKNGKPSKTEYDSQRSTTMTASAGVNQTSIATLTRNNTFTSCEDGNKGVNGNDKINNLQSSRRKPDRNFFWQRFCTFNESMQSQSSTANEIVQDSETQRTGVKRCSSLRTTKNESLKEVDDELENQQLRAHVLDDDRKPKNELNKNQIESEQLPPSDSVYTILIQLQQANSDSGASIKMIGAKPNSTDKNSKKENSNEFTQPDANNNQNDECKPLTIANDLELNSVLHLGSTQQATNNPNCSTDTQQPAFQPQGGQTNADANPSSKTNASTIGGGSSTTAGHYIPQQPKSERKAAKTLSAILFAFIITWTPYNIVALVRAVLSTKDSSKNTIPNTIWLVCYYLCYINSTLNPVCYALCNAAFRRTYIRILKCKWTKSKRTVASQRYQQDETRRLHDFKNNKYRHWMTT